MTLTDIAIRILGQLRVLVHEIHESDFKRTSATLGGSTIGQHVRHTLEFFLCFEAGYERGVINYDKRAHDKKLETDKDFAMATISRIIDGLSTLSEHRSVILEVGYDPRGDEYISVPSSSRRELVYNIEHAVHHMAIIKIGVNDTAPYLSLDPDFGIAASTMRFRMPDTGVPNPLS